jgi:CubicO group peptidase (beta-lactamase class C family)
VSDDSASFAAALAQVTGWPAPNAAVAVTTAEHEVGVVGDVERRHPWASVTKLVTALCVLRFTETGDISLDEPAGPPGSTVRHLLAHASGLGPDGGVILAAPGRRRIYTNAGFDLLGALFAERCGMSFAACATEAVFAPLGMTDTAIEGTPSAGAAGPLADLARLARELLAPTLVAPETLSAAVTVAFPGLDGVLPGFGRHNPNDWGLGFEVRDHKAPHWTGHTNSPATFGHFGQSGSFVWIDPALQLGCAALAGVPFGTWAAQAWPALSDDVVAAVSRPGR